jgi:hypothetical protein
VLSKLAASSKPGRARTRRVGVALAAAALVACALTACAQSPATPAPATTPRADATSSPVEPAAVPTLVPDGDAAANLGYFDATNRALLAEVAAPNGRQVIDTLEAAGFAKSDMEVTPDTTAGNKAVGNIQFSVRMNDTCLVGQIGTAGYNSLAAPMLGTGKCLVGSTRSIDW